MEQNIENLMKVRYKVIASFPKMAFIGDSGFTVGEIFYPDFKYFLQPTNNT